MTPQDYLDILNRGVAVWNHWRQENIEIRVNLRETNLCAAELNGINFNNTDLAYAQFQGAKLLGAEFEESNLIGADFTGATLRGARFQRSELDYSNMSKADLRDARFVLADLDSAKLIEANLAGATIRRCDLYEADLSGANLSMADLCYTRLLHSNLENAILDGCLIHGISAWGMNLAGSTQKNLVITREHEPSITVDNIEIGQFLYLLLHNEKIRYIIETITSKIVLILGRFTPQRKLVLDSIREELRRRDYLPVVFDFDKPGSRDITETITTLAHMAKFIIADITEAKSIPQELQAIVPQLPSVPVQPLLLASESEYGMFEHFKRYPWVLDVYLYKDKEEVLSSLQEKILNPAEEMARRQRQ
ncbi:MAG TPA: pentapeptide repeat-containing protein [Candidatus Saccharimonadales bacterium]|nr:pentapeptide repeat-containing protein [Candidatus Saccharimonadales bacterium]